MSYPELTEFKPPISGKTMSEMIGCYRKSIILEQAFKLNIFNILVKGPKDTTTIAQETDTRPERLELFLNVLVAIELLEKENNKYMNTELANTFLCSNSRFYQGELIMLQLAAESRRQWEKISSWLKEKPVPKENIKEKTEEKYNPFFIKAMAQAGLIHNEFIDTVSFIASHPNFQSAQRILDLGGGHGLYAIALKKIRPTVKATVFDLPQVESLQKEYSQQYNTKIDFYPGNFYKDNLPTEQDVILAFDVFYGSPSQTSYLLKKIYQALSPVGHFYTKHLLLDDNCAKPQQAALINLVEGLIGTSSQIYTRQEMRNMLIKEGFRVEDTVSTGDYDATVIVAKKEETDG